jgi:CRP-like cAMP-binding protein
MPADAVLLADVGFFKVLDDDEQAVLAQRVEHRTTLSGTTIFREGEPGDIMSALRSGQVEL